MQDGEYYVVDDSEAEDAMPPANLMRTAREILARPVSQQELARAWDLSNDLPTQEQRVAACLDRLVSQHFDGPDVPQENAPAAAGVQAPVQPARSIDPENGRQAARDSVGVPKDDDVPAPQKYNKRKRPAVEEVGSDRGGPATGINACATAAGNSRPTKSRKEDKQGDLPEWLLVQFAAVSAAAAPATNSLNTPIGTTLQVARQAGIQADRELHASTEATPALPSSDAVDGSSLLIEVLAVIPDVDTEHAQKLISRHSGDLATCVEHVIDALLGDKSYPKAQPAANVAEKTRKSVTNGDDLLARLKIYLDKDTRARTEGIPLSTYREAAIEYLFEEFPNVPMPFVRNVFTDNNLYWAPTFIELARMSTAANPPYTPLKTARKVKGKGAALTQHELLTPERACYFAKLSRDQAEKEEQLAREKKEQDEIAQGAVFECGCCFDDVALSRMVQCVDAHLFCIDCARKNAETTLGNRSSDITCMDQGGCIAAFSDDILSRILKTPQMLLLEKIRSEKAVQAAGLAGLSYCPHCSFGCVIDNPDEKLFYCLSDDCMKVTCRQCQKPDHLPKSCEEYASDLKTDTIHRVEEAMTEALLKRCPRCSTAVLKESGCNKMYCTTCRIYFCYVCSVKIAGYDHFSPRSNNQSSRSPQGQCQLWDDDKMREYERVEAARAEATEQIRKEKGDPDAAVSEEDLAKLGLKKPETQPDDIRDQAHWRPRFPLPPAPPGRPYEARAARINGHNAILDAVGGNFRAYREELARIREQILQGDQFVGNDARQRAARVYAAYYRGRRDDDGPEGPLPHPVRMPVPQAPVAEIPAAVALPAAPALLEGVAQARPLVAPQAAIPAGRLPQARQRVRGGRA